MSSLPRMHGLTHRKGGPDEIPGIGDGGGAVEWEDVGSGGVPVKPPANARWVEAVVNLPNQPTATWQPIPFAASAEGFYFSNDVPGRPGYGDMGYVYGTASALPKTFTGEHFMLDPALESGAGVNTAALWIKQQSGVYLIELNVLVYSTAAAGDYKGMAKLSGLSDWVGPANTSFYGYGGQFQPAAQQTLNNNGFLGTVRLSVTAYMRADDPANPLPNARRGFLPVIAWAASDAVPAASGPQAVIRCTRLTDTNWP